MYAIITVKFASQDIVWRLKMDLITKTDKNFVVKTEIKKDDIVFYNSLNAPFKFYGGLYLDGKFRRMPEDIARSVSSGVFCNHAMTAGVRLRFKTNSSYVAIQAKFGNVVKLPHCTLVGSTGFDLYAKENGQEIHMGSFIPPKDVESGFESVVDFDNRKKREITINFPIFTEVCELYIGLQKGCKLEPVSDYKIQKPIVYYGSSITHGGCASRPGNTYQAMISRRLGCDFINLGFSGNAKGEQEMADYIKDLDMSIFVYDYDHNAPTSEHLRDTHEKMFLTVREKNPSLPIIIMSRPRYQQTANEKERLNIIKQTYQNALDRGDENVYLLTNKELLKIAKGDAIVDKHHPNDLGFYSISIALGKLIKKILKK